MKKPISFLDLIQTIAIVFGIVYGMMELSNLRAERAQQGALELAQYLQAPGFQAGIAVILEIPDGSSRADIITAFGPDIDLLNHVGQVFETIGVLVWRGELEIGLVDDLLGGGTITAWEKTRPYWEGFRVTMNRPSIAEWFQWLAERLNGMETDRHEPAYKAYQNWTPKR